MKATMKSHMKAGTKTLLVAASGLLLAALASAAPVASAADPLVLSEVHWKARPAKGAGEPRLRLEHKSSTSDVTLDGGRAELGAARGALARGSAGPVEFTVAHEAGVLACTGRLTHAFEGEGDCRFTSDPGFEQALAARGLAPDRRSELLSMLLVDATITLADGLIAEGVAPKEYDDLIAAAALKVTPAYVRELKSGAMALSSIEDAIACKALGVDGAYVRGLAAAGYTNLSSDDVVGMKALGVTPDYARAMNVAVGAEAMQ